ncbi:MAG: hypothetical protein Q8K96_18950 [Rubrivivax sp.]|nr:hypothetical protein [Rubrivivax sp.]
MWRRLLLLGRLLGLLPGLALGGLGFGGLTHAAEAPRLELTATPAWKGWTRPGRATELEIRLTSDAATRATLDVVAGGQSLRSELELQPGRALRLHLPVASAESIAVSAVSAELPGGPPQRREIALAKSESPLLGVGLATGEPVQLEGFHTLALASDDLPRNASAYSSIDALILDAPTLGALDPRQLGALLAHAAGCGRIVVLNTDARVRGLLAGAGACGGRSTMSAGSLAQAREMLQASLGASLPAAMPPGSLGELAQPGHRVWNRVAVGLAVYFAMAALVVVFFASLPVLLLTPALAAVAALALLHTMEPPSQLVVWSEGESGARVARYQAWQQFPGVVGERKRVPIPPQLASWVQPCGPSQAMHFDFDASNGRMAFAEFDTRLFRQVSLCYSGSFPVARAIALAPRGDGQREVRNEGARAWPEGVLLAGGLVHELPALGPGAHTTLAAQTAQAGRPPRGVVERMAMTRTPAGGVAALWSLDLLGVADASVDSRGWLLVSVPSP